MPLSLISNASAMATNITLPFAGIGGATPYVYSVVGGGAGGMINSSTGVYTSPNVTGVDTILVTDASSNTAELDISVCAPIELVCDVIQNQMSLGVGQVYLYNQKLLIPTDSALYIAVGVLSCKPFGNNRSYVSGSGSSLQQVQSTNFQATLSIDIMSRNTQALLRKEEVILALGSSYAESQMELNSFYIAPISSSFINLSEIDGAAIPYRFNISVNIQYLVQKTTATSDFTDFEQPILTTNS